MNYAIVTKLHKYSAIVYDSPTIMADLLSASVIFCPKTHNNSYTQLTFDFPWDAYLY